MMAWDGMTEADMATAQRLLAAVGLKADNMGQCLVAGSREDVKVANRELLDAMENLLLWMDRRRAMLAAGPASSDGRTPSSYAEANCLRNSGNSERREA